jgi:hypothetical protein
MLIAPRFVGIFGVLAGTVLSAPRPAAAEETPAELADRSAVAAPHDVASWIAELDDNRYLVRERATRNLLNTGETALDALLDAANADRPEPADRAVWILRRLGQSADTHLAIAALERLVQVRGRPRLVEKAEWDLAQQSVVACEERLAPLGAELSVQYEPLEVANMVPMLQLRLGTQWQGTTDDLRPVAQLRHQLHYRLEGAAIDDAAIKLFEEKEKLAHLQLRYTKVTPAAVDALKQRHPEAVVYVRNAALLGVSAENHANGVLVQHVEQGTAAAAAGIVPGDIITSLDGKPLPDFDRLTARIAQHQPGEAIDVEILRAGQPQKLTATLGAWPDGH